MDANVLTFDEFENSFGEILYSGSGVIPSEGAKKRVCGVFYKNKKGKIKFEPKTSLFGWKFDTRNAQTIQNLRGMGFEFAKGHERKSAWSLFAHMVGENASCIPKYIEEHKSKNEKLRSDRKKIWNDWEEVRDTFNGIVLGVDREIDYYDTGFTVRIVLSHAPYQERRETLKEKKKELISYVMDELQKNRSFRQKVLSMDFFYPQEIFIFKSVAEAEIKFSIRSERHSFEAERTTQQPATATA